MADPFSILAGSASLADISWRVISYLRQAQAAATRVEDELTTLSKDIESLISVNNSVEDVWASEQKASLVTSVAEAARVKSLWRNVGTNLQDCRGVVEKLDDLLKVVTGKEGSKPAGKFDNLKKQLRRESKDEEFHRLRDRLTTHQNSLQMLLTALNFFYTRSSQNATDLSLGHLSEDVQLLGFKLKSQIASLRPRLQVQRGSILEDNKNASTLNLRDCINVAATEASFVSLNKHFYIPQPVSSIFTGREEQLQELQDALEVSSFQEHNHVQNRFIIYGLGGSGKTQFCCKYAQVNRENFWGIFTIDASSLKSAQHSFARIAKIGGVEPNERAAKNWLSNLDRPWLLLIDNADDSSVSVDEYFSEGQNGFILVTTRNPSNKVHGTLKSKSYHFERLETDEAADLLLKAACEPQPWTITARKSAILIANKLGALPLALVYAGKAIMSRLCSLANYLDYYESNWQRIRRAWSVAGHHGDEDINMNVYSSYEVLYQNLELTRTEESQDAVDLLKLFSFLYYENIRVDVLISAATNPKLEAETAEKEKDKNMAETASKPKSWRQTLKELGFRVLEASLKDRSPPVLPAVLRDTETSVSFQDLRLRVALKQLAQISFITHQQTSDSYSMHPLVHMWVRERPQMSTGEQAIWCEAANTVVAQCILLPPLGSTEKHEDLRRDLLPHLNFVLKQQEIIRGRIEGNRKARKRPWPVIKPTFGRRQALRLAKFSLVYSQCGLWDEAENLQIVVKEFACKMLGIEHPSTISIMLALSGTHFHQTRYNAAAELQDQVLKACMNSLGPDDRKTLKVMDTLGATRSQQGRFKESLELHQRSVDGMIKTLGVDEEDTLLALNNLGKILWWYFRFDEAMELQSQTVAGMKIVLGPTHLSTLQAMENLALVYLSLGEELLWHAHELVLYVLDQREKKLGREHPYTLLSICNLARIKSALDHNDEAEKMLRAAWPIAIRNIGADHFGTLAGQAYLARILARQKNYREAEDMLMSVVQRQKYATAARDDGEHPDRVLAMYFLLECYQLQGNIDDAIRVGDELFEGLSKIGGQGLGLLHPFTKRLLITRAELQAAKKAFGADRLRILEGIQPILP